VMNGYQSSFFDIQQPHIHDMLYTKVLDMLSFGPKSKYMIATLCPDYDIDDINQILTELISDGLVAVERDLFKTIKGDR